VRAVRNGDRWELHLVCKVEIPVEDAPGDNPTGIDLGISNYLAIAYDDGDAELYPRNVLKQDKPSPATNTISKARTARHAVRSVPDRNSRIGKTTSCTLSPSASLSSVLTTRSGTSLLAI